MAKATYWQRGESLDYVNTGSAVIEADTIIAIGSLIGVAGTSINPGEKGSLHVSGTFECPKSSSSAITLGTMVYWDGTGITATQGDSGVPAGYCAADAAAAATSILVKLLG